MNSADMEEGRNLGMAAGSQWASEESDVLNNGNLYATEQNSGRRLRASVHAMAFGNRISGLGTPNLPRIGTRSSTLKRLATMSGGIYDPQWKKEFEGSAEDCVVSIIDYSATDCKMVECGNQNFVHYMKQPRSEGMKVRWINVQGYSHDVIIPIAEHYKLHRLVVEDLFEIPQRVKADHYDNCLYVSLTLLDQDQANVEQNKKEEVKTPHPSKDKNQHVANAKGIKVAADAASMRRRKVSSLRSSGKLLELVQQELGDESDDDEAAKARKDSPKFLFEEQTAMFLMKDADGRGGGTVISFFQRGTNAISGDIMSCLKTHPPTLLRSSEDPSLLLHSIIDHIVDKAAPLLEWYALQIAHYEQKVVKDPRPNALYTKLLYLLYNELKALRKIFLPTQSVVQNLIHHSQLDPQALITARTITFLEDVNDHISTLVENIDSLLQLCKDLIDLIFNTISHQTNRSMQLLTSASMVFLPITFLAGVYGMNFEVFPELKFKMGFLYFWSIALTIATALIWMLKRKGMLDTR